MNLVYIHQTFLPGGEMSDLSLDSIASFFAYIAKYYPTESVRYILGGWAAADEDWKRLEALTKNKPDNCKLILKRFDRNYGKAYIVNDLFFTNSAFIEDFFFTADSDMQFDLNVPYLFERLNEGQLALSKAFSKPCGVLAPFMTVGNCHVEAEKSTDLSWEGKYGKENIWVMKGISGIAGGSLYISKEAFIKIKGYQVRSVYGPDDARLFPSMWYAGYRFGIMESVSLIHPNTGIGKDKHQQWKINCTVSADQETFNVPFDACVKLAEEHWKETLELERKETSGKQTQTS